MLSTQSEIKRISDILANYEPPSGEDDCQTKIDEILEMRERLVQKGFNRSFMPTEMRLSNDLSKAELREIKKQVREMRYTTYLKKSILKQLDYAMASYKIAMLHFKSGALLNAYHHLPYDGNIVRRVSRFGPTAARMYFDLYELLNGELEQLGISLSVAIPSDDGVKYERLQLYGVKDVDDYVSSLYGEDAEIVKTKIITKHKSILTSKAYMKVLACAYAVSGSVEKKSFVMESNEKVERYANILSKHGFNELIRLEALAESSTAVIEELERERLVYFTPTGPYLDEELSLKLNEILNKIYWEYIKDAYGKVALDLIRLIILTTKNTRRGMGVFSFDDDIQLIKPVLEKAGLVGIVRPYDMIIKKMEMEDTIGCSREIGLALFAYFQGKEKLKNVFGVDFSMLRQEYGLVKAYLEKEGGRGEKFLEHLRR